MILQNETYTIHLEKKMAVWEDLPLDLQRRIRLMARTPGVAHEVALLDATEHMLLVMANEFLCAETHGAS